jgi:dTDP-4-amino-4,6-dideoxygalactose transaminase
VTIVLNQPLKPNLPKLTKYLERVNDSGWYTNFGPLHQELTARLESYLGVKNLLLVSNGTLALQVAYKALNTQSALTTPFSFVATASSLIWQGIETSFCDIDMSSYNLCPIEVKKALHTNKNIDTIVATHVYGNPCNVKVFDALAEEHNVKVIYDAAHAFAVKIGDKSILSFGDASTLSFHSTKVFHTVEGGAIVFKHKADFERAKRLINFGIDVNGNITEAGINAKLNEYQCAVGLTILDQIDDVLEHRSALFTAYRYGLKDVVEMPNWYPDTSFNGAYMPINLCNDELVSKTVDFLNDNNVQSRRYFKPSLDKVFGKQQNYGSKVSERITQGILCLPLHSYMTLDNVIEINKLIKKVIK